MELQTLSSGGRGMGISVFFLSSKQLLGSLSHRPQYWSLLWLSAFRSLLPCGPPLTSVTAPGTQCPLQLRA